MLTIGIEVSKERSGQRRVSEGASIMSWTLVGKVLFAALFVAGGIGHFIATDFYMKMMPPYLPLHCPLVLLSGIAEIALGILLLIPQTSRFAAWGLIALLIAVFPANIHIYQHQE